VAIQMLQDLHGVHAQVFAEAGDDNALNNCKAGKNILTDACKKFDDLNKVDKSGSLGTSRTGQVNHAGKHVMLKNTEQADLSAEKSDQLNEQASVFKKKSGDLRKEMACKNLKMTSLLGGTSYVS
jgi:vesicle-associated membrane protein 7